jgi:hypothetical protein
MNHDPFFSELRSPPPKRTISFFGKLSDLFTDEEGNNDEEANNVMIEVRAYNKEKCIDPEADPLKYWKVILLKIFIRRYYLNRRINLEDNEKTYPILVKITRRLLSPTATSQPNEQLFSVARDVYNYRRSNLDPENAEKLILIKNSIKNFPLLKFLY